MFLFVAKLEQNFEKHETSAIEILPRKAQFQSSGLHICAALPASALIFKAFMTNARNSIFFTKTGLKTIKKLF